MRGPSLDLESKTLDRVRATPGGVGTPVDFLDLGLTTAAPAQVTALTDARLRSIQLGAQKIQFKQAAPSRLYWAGHPAMRIVQALYWLKDVLPTDGPDIKRRLRNHITHPQRGDAILVDLWRGFAAMPTWMQSFVRELFADMGTDNLLTGPPPAIALSEPAPTYSDDV